MKKEPNIVYLIASVCFLAAAGFVVAGVAYAVLGRSMGWTGQGLHDRVVYNMKSGGAQFATELYGKYAHAVPFTEEVVLAPTEYGVVATTYEQSPAWMRLPCGAQRVTGIPSSPYAVLYQEKIYSLYEDFAEVMDPRTGESSTVSGADVPEILRELTTGQVYGTDPLPEGVQRLADAALAVQQDETVLLQMDDYSCSSTFLGGLAAAALFLVVATAAWIYDRRRG
jgi:hypothetical protein